MYNTQFSPEQSKANSLAKASFVLVVVQTCINIFFGLVLIGVAIAAQKNGHADKNSYTATFIFAGVYLFSLCWQIPFLVIGHKLLNNPERESLGLGITMIVLGFLLFGLLVGIGGILLTVRRPIPSLQPLNSTKAPEAAASKTTETTKE